MPSEIRQLIIGITREGELVVKSARGRMYPVKKSDDLNFGCEELFQNTEVELYAVIDTESQPWECIKIE